MTKFNVMKILFSLLVVSFAFSYSFSQEKKDYIVVQVDMDETDKKVETLKGMLSGEFVMVEEDDYEAYFECGADCEKDLETLNAQDEFLFRKLNLPAVD